MPTNQRHLRGVRLAPVSKRRGSIYFLVLGLSLVLTVIGIGAVMVERAGTRTMNDSGDWTEAQALAFSAVEHAMAKVGSDSGWRTTYSSQTVTKSLGRGAFSWRLTDEAGGSVAEDSGPFYIVATATVGRASYSTRTHMAPGSEGAKSGAIVSGAVALTGSARIDSYDSSLGAYGGSNVGSNATLVTNSTSAGGVSLAWSTVIQGSVQVGPGGNPASVVSQASGHNVTGSTTTQSQATQLPTITAPTNLGASTGDLSIGGMTVTTITGTRHVNNLSVTNSGRLKISGSVTILAENNFSLDGSGVLELLPGATLTMYVKGNMAVGGSGNTVLNGQNISGMKFLVLGASVAISGSGNVVQSTIIAPNANVQISGSGSIGGLIVAQRLSLSGSATFHEDRHITSGADPVVIGSGGSGTPRADSWARVVQ